MESPPIFSLSWVQRSTTFGGGALTASTPTNRFEMDVKTEGEIQELEEQVAALKKENTRLKNEMRFNLDQEK